ncbi:AAA family ATPase [Streptomyces sp. NPDC002793]|uniref:helix-turn-helix transcriptional regulator n=1 Tax=Streptomyces sp. NPDC002793 TaxID=3154432 RepID=UPI00332E75C3
MHREEELALLRRAYHDCERQGRGQVALIAGAVGSGKTHMLEQHGKWAAAAGGRILTATGSRAERNLHFGVLGQLLHGLHLGQEESARIEDLTREAASSLTTATAGSDDSDTLPVDGPLWGPLLRSVHAALSRAAAQQPLLLAVDELHHTDAASLHCLLFVIRRLRHAPITVVFAETSVPGSAHPVFHAELRSQPYFAGITLPPLTTDSIIGLLGQEGRPADIRQEAGRLLRMTGGSSLLVQALIDERDAPGNTDDNDPREDDTFKRAVLGCLYRHEPAVRQVAEALAVLGRPVSPELLDQLLDVLPNTTAPAVRALHNSGLVEHNRIRHPRIRHCLLSDLAPERKQKLHRRAAEVLHEGGEEPSVVAEHLIASAWTDTPWASPVLQRAAAQALAAGRPDLAAASLRLETQEETAGQDIATTAMLVSARWQNNPTSVGQQLDHLVKSARADGWSTTAALSAVPYLLWQGRVDEAVEAVEGFRTAGPDDDPAGRRRTMELLIALSNPDHLASARESAGSRHRITEVPPSAGPRLRALSVLGGAMIPSAGNNTVVQAEQLLQQYHADPGSLGLLAAPLLALLYSGRADRVASWGEILLKQPPARHAPAWLGVIRAIHAEAALRLGDHEATERLGKAALVDVPCAGWGVAVGGPLGTLVTCATEQGRHAEAERWLAQPVPPGMFRTPAGIHYLAARGRHHLAMGRAQAATADLRRCGEQMRHWGLDTAGLLTWRLELAKVQLSLGNRTHAAQLLLEQLRVPHGLDDRTRGRALRLLASTAVPDQRHKLLSKAVTLLQASGDQQELMLALNDISHALQRSGDSAQARLFVRWAHQLAQGAADGGSMIPGQQDRRQPAGGTREQNGQQDAASWEADPVLSEAEHRVAVLAAQGNTNRQISDALFITVSTVEQHLTRAYRKLDVKRRTDLPKRLASCAGPVAEEAEKVF